MSATADLPPRSEWMRHLQAVPRARRRSVAEDLSARHQIRHHRPPATGLSMLRVREPCLGESYFLGEVPLAEAAVAIAADDGQEVLGGAVAMVDGDDEVVELAICDGVLAGRLAGWTAVAELVAAGARATAEEDRVRAGLMARTTVDFDLLESEDDDD